MAFPKFTKDPDAVLDYEWDWSDWLAPVDDTIETIEFITTGDITVESSNHSGTAVIAWVSGGVAGQSPTITCRITTVGERTDDRTYVFKIVDR